MRTPTLVTLVTLLASGCGDSATTAVEDAGPIQIDAAGSGDASAPDTGDAGRPDAEDTSADTAIEDAVDASEAGDAVDGGDIRDTGDVADDTDDTGHAGDAGDDADATATDPECGNGRVEAEEDCDDGNDRDDDACLTDCTAPVCGDGILSVGEACDDGNSEDGDGCESDCSVTRPEGCGDGAVADGEECDDGNAVDDDDCSNVCRRPFCGDRILQRSYGEECDDGNLVNDDRCTNRCSLPACGDGVIQDGETCDDGGDNSDTEPDTCRTDCTNARCGDGVTDTAEECDDANDIVTDGCTTRCTLPVCGDGIVQEDEACDRGASNSDTMPDTCRTDCTNARCGDGVLDSSEACDDGDDDDTNGCSNACELPVCGDGVVNGGEECDDGDRVPNDECTNACTLPACGDGIIQGDEACDRGRENSDTEPDTCRTDCTDPRCGDGTIDSDEACDDADDVDTDECSNACVLPVCGDGVVNGEEECDDADDIPNDECTNRCMLPACGDGIIQGDEACDRGRDNSDTAADACRTDCTNPSCGDGVRDDGELCDDGNTSNADSCTNACRDAICGDGFVQPGIGEACDDGGDNSDVAPNACRTDCAMPACGDDVVDDGEACDDGEDNSDFARDACRSSCALPGCGDGVVDDGEGCDDGDLVNDDECTNACTTPRCGDAIVQAGEACDDGNDTNTDACTNACRFPICGDGIVQPVNGEDCDDGDRIDTDECTNACELPGCGDGIVQPGEDCDDGDRVNTDECSNACRFPECGDGIVQLAEGERCDDGNDINDDDCTNGCALPICGDGIVQDEEECDDGEDNDDEAANACRTTCVQPSCGDRVRDADEACDDGNSVDGDLCSNACTLPICGDGIVQVANGEECDDGGREPLDGCDADCLREAPPEPGRVVFFGHDLLIHGENEAQLLRNLVTLGADDAGRVSVLVYTEFVGPLDDVVNTINVLTSLNSRGYTLTLTTFDESVELFDLLPAADVLVVVDQDNDLSGSVLDVAEEWQPALLDFVNAGGVVIVQAGSGTTDGFLNAAGLLDTITGSAVAPGARVETVARAETAGVASSYFSSVYTRTLRLPATTTAITLVEEPVSGRPVVALRETSCGDGVVDDLEECDDGNRVPNDGCNNRCETPACGDGVLQAGEECDDGNFSNLDACTNACEAAQCGDGFLQFDLGEACDDGAANSNTTPNACRADCRLPVCGDLVVDDGEECDDGNVIAGDGCTACREPGCGDGLVQAGEECDDGNSFELDACSSTCVAARCGDGVRQRFVGEECDDGNVAGSDGCSSTCRRGNPEGWGAFVGHDFLETSPEATRLLANLVLLAERTDDLTIAVFNRYADLSPGAERDVTIAALRGALDSLGVRHTIREFSSTSGLATQLDGADVLLSLEFESLASPPVALAAAWEADLATFLRGGGIFIVMSYGSGEHVLLGLDGLFPGVGAATRRPAGVATIDVPATEVSSGLGDYQQINGTTTLTFGAPVPGAVNAAVWRDGLPVVTMRRFLCGDGAVQAYNGEACDDGNTVETDGCRSTCRLPACGDGVVHPGEECDDGNAIDTDGCLADCTLPVCGDGIVSAGEDCDDGNEVNGDDCSNACTVNTPPSCAVNLGSATGTPVREGNLRTASNSVNSGCGVSAAEPDVTFFWRAPTAGTWRFSTDGTEDETALSLYTRGISCRGDLIECSAPTDRESAQIDLYLDAGESVLIVVDSLVTTSGGTWGGSFTIGGDYDLNINPL